MSTDFAALITEAMIRETAELSVPLENYVEVVRERVINTIDGDADQESSFGLKAQ